MPQREITARLREFANKHQFRSKGRLCVALVVTRIARKEGLPLDPESLLSEQGGQVRGLGKAGVQRILSDYGIERVLASEGARTSRGSIQNMRTYVAFLNDSAAESPMNFEEIERFWIGEVEKFFAGKPFRLRYDTSRSLRDMFRELLNQAFERQNKGEGTMYAGTMLQHLVGAKLECALGKGRIEHHCSSTSDQQSDRAGDFLVGEAAIHVTTTPTESILRRCIENLEQGLRPMIVTLPNRLAALHENSEMAGITARIDFFDIEQFLALNLYEFAKFEAGARKVAIQDVLDGYNQIIDQYETDPSLRIELK